jgi:hypothetical protein
MLNRTTTTLQLVTVRSHLDGQDDTGASAAPAAADREVVHESWCSDHDTYETDHVVETCATWPYVLPAPVEDAAPTLALCLSSSPGVSAPYVSITMRGGVGCGLEPDEARRLAAALLETADIVEASRTETCRECGKAAHPILVDDGVCYLCQGEQRKQRLATMRGGAR